MVTVQADQEDCGAVALPAHGLDDYPGPVLLFDAHGTLVSARPSDGVLAEALRGPGLPDLADVVDATRRSGTARLDSLQVEARDGVHAFDLTVLPLADGGVAVLGHEVTLHHNLRAALVESRQRYKDFVEISSDFAWETGSDGAFIFVSPRGALGHSANALVGRDPGDLVLEREADADLPFHARAMIEDVELWLRRADGGAACLSVSAKPIYDRDGRWIGARGVCRDITGDRERDAQLARARNRERVLNHIVRTFRDEVNPSDMLRVAAETVGRGLGAESCHIFRRALDRDCEEGPGLTLGEDCFIGGARHGPQDYAEALPVLRQMDEAAGLVETEVDGRAVMAVPTRYHHTVNGAVILWRARGRGPWGGDDRLLLEDVADQIGIANEQIAAHEDIVRISRTDGLTGLFNRRAFFEELTRRFNRLSRGEGRAALMYVDLDNFKMVNDALGHAEGDAVLMAVRDMLVANTRPTDLVARLGGDEFALWLDGADAEVGEAKARRLIDLAEEFLRPRSGAPDQPLGFSIGVAVHDADHPESQDEMIGRADTAMYTVKRGGKLGYAMAPLPPPRPTGGGVP